KRPCLFLRWMVRPDDGVDLGLWRGVPPRKLVMPVDVHIARAARRLGLSRRKTADWKMALEITAALRTIDAEDPLRYDFPMVYVDGTILNCARRLGGAPVPAIGVNIGKLGFLAEFTVDEVVRYLDGGLAPFRLVPRIMLRCRISGRKDRLLALNDAVITQGPM